VRAVCAWCGKDMEPRGDVDPAVTTHGICEDCFLDLRVKETLKRLQKDPGPFDLFLPPRREHLVMRIWREAPAGALFVIHPDRRSGDRRALRAPVPADRRAGRDRRFANLSFVASSRRSS